MIMIPKPAKKLAEPGPYTGTPVSRVDGRAKCVGTAKYAAEFNTDGLVHGYILNSAITKGRITSIDTSAALALPGVLAVFTHENRPKTAWFDKKWKDEVSPAGSPFRPLYDDKIEFGMQQRRCLIHWRHNILASGRNDARTTAQQPLIGKW